MPLIIRAESRAGDRYELRLADFCDLAEARRRATRAAELFATIDTAGTFWVGSRVTVHDAGTGRLVFVARIVRGKAVRT